MKAIVSLSIWVIIVTYLSLSPSVSGVRHYFPLQDKLVHFVFYFVMVLLILKSFHRVETKEKILAILMTALYGIFMEYMQDRMGMGRHFDYFDILANISGSLTGAAIYILNPNRRR